MLPITPASASFSGQYRYLLHLHNTCSAHAQALLVVLGLLLSVPAGAQAPADAPAGLPDAFAFGESDSLRMRAAFDQALTASSAYPNLVELCTEIGPRLSGSDNAARAVQWAADKLRGLGCDSVWLQPVLVPHWVRGERETAEAYSASLNQNAVEELQVCALGGSVGTWGRGTPDAPNRIRAGVVEVFGLDDLEAMGRERLEGKIVLYNRPMEPRLISTFAAYSGCVDQRGSGAAVAAEYGAVAVLVRSMNLRDDDLPHTGVMRYRAVGDSIPAAAISTRDASMLSRALRQDPNLEVGLELSCKNLPDVWSANVIGEIRGSVHPDRIIAVGGHLDSWDLAQGAHDDGTGVVQSMAVLEAYRALGWRPQHTLRCVLWMNEENGARGAKVYAESVAEAFARTGEQHVLAVESDRGGFTPRGFAVDGLPEVQARGLERLRAWTGELNGYGLHWAEPGHAGVDIGYLKDQGVLLLGLVPDSQRYFDYHHAANDRIEAVNKRELELGTAAMVGMIDLFDRNMPQQIKSPPTEGR